MAINPNRSPVILDKIERMRRDGKKLYITDDSGIRMAISVEDNESNNTGTKCNNLCLLFSCYLKKLIHTFLYSFFSFLVLYIVTVIFCNHFSLSFPITLISTFLFYLTFFSFLLTLLPTFPSVPPSLFSFSIPPFYSLPATKYITVMSSSCSVMSSDSEVELSEQDALKFNSSYILTKRKVMEK